MCLSVPMQIVEIDGHRARCVALDQERWADLTLIGPEAVTSGDYVLIHLGLAQRVVPEPDALEAQALFRAILRELDGTG